MGRTVVRRVRRGRGAGSEDEKGMWTNAERRCMKRSVESSKNGPIPPMRVSKSTSDWLVRLRVACPDKRDNDADLVELQISSQARIWTGYVCSIGEISCL